MITIQEEKFSEALPEMSKLFDRHWEELSADKKFRPNLDLARYHEAENIGALFLATVRNDGQIVGYLVAVIIGHLHYAGAGLMSIVDMYYILPEFRIGGVGGKLLLFVEEAYKKRGVVKAYMSHKVHQDHSELFKAMGWNPTDIMYTKLLGAN